METLQNDKPDKKMEENNSNNSLMRSISQSFNLFYDKATDLEIERRIRESVDLTGSAPWILICAIVVASVGLNVNSTAVIIGAMLISPLMGPIMGAGLGVAVNDFSLAKKSFLNLVVSTAICIGVSAFYFSLTPLQEPQSELLGRTYPTLWDVLIALFGGFAGVVGMTRLEKSNVIPGVAIATALMPPACTIGYGLAIGNLKYFLGASYLYTINCVFIAIATFIGIRIMKLPLHHYADKKKDIRVRNILWILAICTAIPSIYSAANLVKYEVYKTKARNFIKQEFSRIKSHVTELDIRPSTKEIEIALIGEPVKAEQLKEINGRLAAEAQLAGSSLVIHQTDSGKLDVTALKSTLLSDLYNDTQIALDKKEKELIELRKQLADKNAIMESSGEIFKELRIVNPLVEKVFVSQGIELYDDDNSKELLQLTVKSKKPLSEQAREQIKKWFSVRTKATSVRVVFELDDSSSEAKLKHPSSTKSGNTYSSRAKSKIEASRK